MGIVLAKIPVEDFEEVIPTAGYRGRGFSSGQGEKKYLFRLANPEERASLASKVQEEERALEVSFNSMHVHYSYSLCYLFTDNPRESIRKRISYASSRC